MNVLSPTGPAEDVGPCTEQPPPSEPTSSPWATQDVPLQSALPGRSGRGRTSHPPQLSVPDPPNANPERDSVKDNENQNGEGGEWVEGVGTRGPRPQGSPWQGAFLFQSPSPPRPPRARRRHTQGARPWRTPLPSSPGRPGATLRRRGWTGAGSDGTRRGPAGPDPTRRGPVAGSRGGRGGEPGAGPGRSWPGVWGCGARGGRPEPRRVGPRPGLCS